MKKIVNSWNEWDPLKRVILGRPEGTNIPAPEPAWQHECPDFPLGTYGPFPEEMVHEANAQMDNYVSVLEKYGATVERVVIQDFMFNKPVSTPYWTAQNCYGSNNARDVILIHGNRIIEATTSRRSRFYEYFNYRPLFEKYMEEDPDVIYFATPKPRLTDDIYEKNYYHNFNYVWSEEEKRKRMYEGRWQISEKEPLWDAADVARFGKDLFVQNSCVTNKKAIDWLKRIFGEFGIRVHAVQFDSPREPDKIPGYHPWHIDVNLAVLRPGLCMYNPDWPAINPEFWELFKINGWELVPAVRPTYKFKNRTYLYAEYDQVSWISMNTLTLDHKTICVEAHEPDYCDQLDKLGMNVITVPYEKVIPFGGSLHCTTLDVYREGKMEDYFPKQVKGF